MVPILDNLFQKIETGRTLSNSFYEDSITLISKPDKQKSEVHSNIYSDLGHEDVQQNIIKLSPMMYKRILHHNE